MVICDFCDYNFNSVKELFVHYQEHIGFEECILHCYFRIGDGYGYICNLEPNCRKKQLSLKQAISHVFKHYTIKDVLLEFANTNKLLCEICGFMYLSNENIENPIQCTSCIQNHTKEHEPFSIEEISVKRCPSCHIPLTTLELYQTHVFCRAKPIEKNK